uniref:Tr-type G domain-containing protein n=1 Tax=Globodera rostochiensis TaxID=31243 RepID=A0A914GQR8_GLORO
MCPPSSVRNVCIIAHVDHGKTTLADFLVSANGVISARLAGKLRYMDCREDEQMRGITMKSSSISLFYEPLLLNLIDSPGHVDFVAEVSSAVNLADIAILVVDVVEGVCSQTESLIRQALSRKLDILLVVNKLDRLVRLLESVNSCLSQAIHGQLLEEDWNTFEQMENQLHFDSSKGNVLFASALYGYAFAAEDFAELWAKRIIGPKCEGKEPSNDQLKRTKKQLNDNLFSSDHFFSANSKQICSGAEQRGKKPLLEQFVLEPLWELHRCALVEEDLEKLRQMSAKLSLPLLKGRRAEEAFTEMMRQWLPLSSAVVRACARMRSAQKAFQADDRIGQLFSSECEVDELTLVFCAKAFKLESHRVSLCRVMSGTLKIGDQLNVLRSSANSKSLVPGDAWHSVQIVRSRWSNLRDRGIRWALDWRANAELESVARHRVTVRPTNAGMDELNELRSALKQLSVLDSAVRVLEQEDGDLAMLTAGEVHLQKCLEDLKLLGQTEIVVSEPIVPFLETLIPDPRLSYAKIISGHKTECFLRQFSLRMTLRAVPLHDQIVQMITQNEKLIDSIIEGVSDPDSRHKLDAFQSQLSLCACNCLPKMKGSWWAKHSIAEIRRLFSRIWAFGPSRAQSNIFFNGCPNGQDENPISVWKGNLSSLDQAVVAGFHLAMSHGPLCDEPMQNIGIVLEEWEEDETEGNGISEGTERGETTQKCEDANSLVGGAQLQGQLISAIRQTCRVALKKHIGSLRLLAALYRCAVQTPTQSLGKVQAVLAQKRAKMLSEEFNELTGLFEVVAHLPVIESFHFCEDLRKRTSGTASAQLEFSCWQLIEEDPFWQPTTEEEVEEFGNRGFEKNQARLYVDTVRRRKGLPVEEVIVVSAEKQRNLKRNK